MMVLELKEISIGRWSELSAVSVVHVIFPAMVLEAVEISGEVGFWSMCGCLVGVFSFRIICVEFVRMSEIRAPLWSSVCPNQVEEWAFMSLVIMCGPRRSRKLKARLMSSSSVLWSGSVVCLGGI